MGLVAQGFTAQQDDTEPPEVPQQAERPSLRRVEGPAHHDAADDDARQDGDDPTDHPVDRMGGAEDHAAPPPEPEAVAVAPPCQADTTWLCKRGNRMGPDAPDRHGAEYRAR